MRLLRTLTLGTAFILAGFSFSSFADTPENPALATDDAPKKEEATTKFCVFLGEYGATIPVKEAIPIGNTEGASCLVSDDGIFQFYSPLYETEAEAEEALIHFAQLGLTKVQKMVYHQGAYYTPAEYASF